MKRAMVLLLGLTLVSATLWADDKKGSEKKGGQLTDPVKILKKVDAACKSVKAVKYDVTCETTGETKVQEGKVKAKVQGGKVKANVREGKVKAKVQEGKVKAKARTKKLQASVTVVGFADGRPEKSLIEVTTAMPGSKEGCRITGGTDGETFFVIDHHAKKAYEDIDPQVIGSFKQALGAGMMIEFVHPTPFSDEINGKVKEFRGSKRINGEDCYEVYVVYATELPQAATWYFSKNDFLPRGRIDEFTTPDGQKLGQKKMISNLIVEPMLDQGAFTLKLPKGYTKSDDFAP